MKKILILLFGLISAGTVAQTSFKIVADDTGDPLIGATAMVKSADSSSKEQLISNGKGEFTTRLALPIEAEIRHVGFETSHVVISKKSQTVKLKPSSQALDEVIVTGQYQPQSAKNAVYNVRSIGTERIETQNANSIQDLLSNELNIQINRDNATGRSGISMQGLSGQYTKILLDGVPLVGKGGIDNDIDLVQIDIQQVDRIEIVEGPMAVSYGADALAGVINIITKKDIPCKLQADFTLQTESAGDEYSFFDEGIYSPSIVVGYDVNKHFFSQISSRYYRFGGWQGNAEGRQKQWYPKEQWFGGFVTRYTSDNLEIHYRLDALDEAITSLGRLIVSDDNSEPFSFDEEYHANRFIHQLQSTWNISEQSTLNSIFSFTNYERLSLNYRRFPQSDVEFPVSAGNDTIYYRNYFTRNTLNQLKISQHVNLQVGVELTYEEAGGSTLSEGEKSITDLAGFASAEMVFGDLKIRPGIRYTRNSQFSTVPTPAINFFYGFTEQLQFRLGYGRGFRAPSVRELHHEFIDANHNLIGNPDLQPEKSHNFNLSIDQRFQKLPLSIELGGFYNDVEELIGISASEDGREQSYLNISEFKSLGGNLRVKNEQSGFDWTIGLSRIGRLQRLREEEGVPDFVFATELIARSAYTISSVDLTASIFYKYTGPINRFQTDSDTGEAQEVGQEGFHNLDINLAKSFGSFKLGAGARNVLNITNIQATAPGGVHGGGNTVPVGFGRSFYLRLNYQFNL